MGMYDTLNGEQVKCFPWYSFDAMPLAQAGFINGHGGSLAYYGDGSKIPYRSLAYNYSKNFIIFDFNPDGLTMDDNNNWVAHVIEDGLLKASVYKENAGDEFEEILKRSHKNISYYGGSNFKFKSIADVNQYAVESDELMKKTKKLHETADKIMREWFDALKEVRLKNIKKGTPEYAELSSKMDQFSIRHTAETDRIKPEIEKLRQAFAEKWTENESKDYLKMSDFGKSIESGILTLKCKKIQEKEPKEKLVLAKEHGIFFDRQKEWQCYCEYFKKTYGEMLEKEGEEFWEKYFEWCEITDEERKKVDELRKELGV